MTATFWPTQELALLGIIPLIEVTQILVLRPGYYNVPQSGTVDTQLNLLLSTKVSYLDNYCCNPCNPNEVTLGGVHWVYPRTLPRVVKGDQKGQWRSCPGSALYDGAGVLAAPKNVKVMAVHARGRCTVLGKDELPNYMVT
jgi:hypothetical protein